LLQEAVTGDFEDFEDAKGRTNGRRQRRRQRRRKH
jgi:hypothetical protein